MENGDGGGEDESHPVREWNEWAQLKMKRKRMQ